MRDAGAQTRCRSARLWSRRAGLAAMALALVACGKEPDKPKSMWPGGDPAPKKAEEAAKNPEDELYTVLGENPKWKPIAPLFESYAKQPIEGIADPMLPGLVRFVERPIIDEHPEVDTAENAKATEEAKTEEEADLRTVADLDQYKLVILVTGVAQAKAVVVDRAGHKITLVRGDPLGKEGGRVEAILQYKMLVSVPGKAKPVEISIAPPMSELESEAGQEDSGL